MFFSMAINIQSCFSFGKEYIFNINLVLKYNGTVLTCFTFNTINVSSLTKNCIE